MTSENARIRTALLSIHPTSRRPAWHGAPTVLGLLRGVKPELAVWRPYPSMNNIREIGLHVVLWENSVANRLSGESVRVAFEQRKTGWVVRSDSVDAAQWEKEVRSIATAHERLVNAVTQFEPGRLDEPLGPNSKRIAIGSSTGSPSTASIMGPRSRCSRPWPSTLGGSRLGGRFWRASRLQPASPPFVAGHNSTVVHDRKSCVILRRRSTTPPARIGPESEKRSFE